MHRQCSSNRDSGTGLRCRRGTNRRSCHSFGECCPTRHRYIRQANGSNAKTNRLPCPRSQLYRLEDSSCNNIIVTEVIHADGAARCVIEEVNIIEAVAVRHFLRDYIRPVKQVTRLYSAEIFHHADSVFIIRISRR